MDVILNQFLTNPVFQGAVVSMIVAQLKKVFESLDTTEKDPAAVKNVQLVVLGMSLVATLLSAWAQGHLGQVDMNAVVNFVTVLLGALGTNSAGKAIKAVVKK